ncbi:MAG: tRNA (guanosine(37)-N1)-methyltransferase TrmD [Candidatus Coatesbacteria bacterium]|nr:tRNA (guanosine(37)-N1)-methyltransferase TrmD [Candidatus Coatesbacteria bacterium]
MLTAHVITIFPDFFGSFLAHPLISKATDIDALSIRLHDLREYTHDNHRSVDDMPFGGGPGMVLMPGPLFEAVDDIREDGKIDRVILLTPQGRPLDQDVVAELSAAQSIALICGRYEGVDERVREHLATEEYSIGDYVLAGGELPAMVLLEAIVRLLPGVVGREESTFDESHSFAMLEYPQYTRPSKFRDWKVPKVLLSGDHQRIERWRARQSLLRTLTRRPDLVAGWRGICGAEELSARLQKALNDE